MAHGSLTRLFPALAFLLTLPAASLLPAQGKPAQAEAATYTIDPVHSETGFTIRHFFTKVRGRFTRFSGTIRMDSADITRSSVEVAIQAASINTDNDMRDKDLRSPKFFGVDQFPAITFQSTRVKKAGKDKLDVTGVLTMHGVSKTIVLPVSLLGSGPGMTPGSYVAGFESSLSLNRSDFGVSAYASDSGDKGLVGKMVDITLNIEADRQNSEPDGTPAK